MELGLLALIPTYHSIVCHIKVNGKEGLRGKYEVKVESKIP